MVLAVTIALVMVRLKLLHMFGGLDNSSTNGNISEGNIFFLVLLLCGTVLLFLGPLWFGIGELKHIFLVSASISLR